MKLSVMQENLARGLSVVSRAVSSRSTLPVLAQRPPPDRGRRPQADRHEPRDRDHLLGAGQDREDGATTVPARLLTDIVAAAGSRARRARAPGRRHAPHPLRPLRDPRQGHRRGGVPGDPDGRRAADDPGLPEGPQARPRGDDLRRGQRRGPADPDRRPRQVRGRAADAGGGRQLPDRRQDHRHPRSRRGRQPVVIPARSLTELARILNDTDDPVERDARPGPQPGPLPPRGHRPRQPPDRRPVPELPAGAAEGPHDPGRSRPRGAAARRCAWRRSSPAPRPTSSSSRSAARTAAASSSPRRPTSATTRATSRPPSRATGRRSRSTRATSRTCWRTSGRAVRARAQRPAVAGRLPADRRRRVRPRGHARPDDLLTGARRHLQRTTGDPGRGRRDLAGATRPICSGSRSATCAATRSSTRPSARAPAAPRAERRRQDQPARGDRAAGIGPVAPHARRRRDGPLGRRSWPGSRPASASPARLRAARRRRGRPAARGDRRRSASGSASTACRAGPRRLVGVLRTVLFAPEEMLLVAGSPALRREALDRLAGQRSAAVPARPRHLRARAPAAQRPAAADPRGAGDPRPARASGTDARSSRGRRSGPSGSACSRRSPSRWPPRTRRSRPTRPPPAAWP